MNCDEFRRQLLTDPYRDDAPFRAHSRVCTECTRAKDEALRFEQRLRGVLSTSLSSDEEQELKWSGSARSGSRRNSLLALPLLLVALWIGLRAGLGPDSEGDLAGTVVAHILGEPEHLQSRDRILESSLRSLFRSLGADVDQALGPVIFAGRCVIGEGEGIHLVLPGENGAVTALFMPENTAPERREIAGGGFRGTIVPAGFGSLAIVGKPGEPLEPVARRLLGAVRWNESGQSK